MISGWMPCSGQNPCQPVSIYQEIDIELCPEWSTPGVRPGNQTIVDFLGEAYTPEMSQARVYE
jgi:hypothetical protein